MKDPEFIYALGQRTERAMELHPARFVCDMTPAELVVALRFRAARMAKRFKPGSDTMTRDEAYCIINELEAAADEIEKRVKA